MKMFWELKTKKISSLFFMYSLIWEEGVTETLHTEGTNYYFPLIVVLWSLVTISRVQILENMRGVTCISYGSMTNSSGE